MSEQLPGTPDMLYKGFRSAPDRLNILDKAPSD